MFHCEKIRDDFYVFSQRGVRCFLLTGAEEALLIDCAFEGNLLEECRKLTQAPITLILTHADLDHIGCIDQFGVPYLHPDDVPRLRAKTGMDLATRPMTEGTVISAGQYRFQIHHMPGHTPGNVVLYDRKQQLLIAGDTVQDVPIYMFGEGRDLKKYVSSLRRLKELTSPETVFYSSHGTLCLESGCIDTLISTAEKICSGEVKEGCTPKKPLPEYVKEYRDGRAGFLMDSRVML